MGENEALTVFARGHPVLFLECPGQGADINQAGTVSDFLQSQTGIPQQNFRAADAQTDQILPDGRTGFLAEQLLDAGPIAAELGGHLADIDFMAEIFLQAALDRMDLDSIRRQLGLVS